MIAGARSAFFQQEIDELDEYIKRGGSVVVFLDPYQDGGLAPFLRRYDIRPLAMSIVDKTAKLPNGGDLFPAVSQYGSHAITRNLSQLSFFPVAQPLEIINRVPENLTVVPLVQTSISAWAESDRQSLLDENAEFDPGTDIPGPLNIGVALEIAGKRDREPSRLVVFGDSDFLADSYLFMAGNRDLALNTLAWATSREGHITVRSREWGFTPIILTQWQQRLVFWFSLCLMPGIVVIAGIMVQVRWMRK